MSGGNGGITVTEIPDDQLAGGAAAKTLIGTSGIGTSGAIGAGSAGNSSASSSGQSYEGTAAAGSGSTEFNALNFLAQQLDNEQWTGTIVRILAVYNVSGGSATPGTVAPSGYVDVQPLINQVDGFGNAVPHRTIYKMVYYRQQGGPNAIICDPEENDVGFALFADHDISTAITGLAGGNASNTQTWNPGSGRRFDPADGVYLGGLPLNTTPKQYITFTKDSSGNRGINWTDANANSIVSNNQGMTFTDCNGNIMAMTSSGIAFTSTSLTNTGEITAGQGSGDQVTVQKHTHGGVQSGSSHTDQPDAGT